MLTLVISRRYFLQLTKSMNNQVKSFILTNEINVGNAHFSLLSIINVHIILFIMSYDIIE